MSVLKSISRGVSSSVPPIAASTFAAWSSLHWSVSRFEMWLGMYRGGSAVGTVPGACYPRKRGLSVALALPRKRGLLVDHVAVPRLLHHDGLPLLEGRNLPGLGPLLGGPVGDALPGGPVFEEDFGHEGTGRSRPRR